MPDQGRSPRLVELGEHGVDLAQLEADAGQHQAHAADRMPEVGVLRRGVKRPKLEDKGRIFGIRLMRLLDTWREVVLIVQPETVIA